MPALTSLRFIHTSDLHLDTSFAGSGFPSRLGDRKREAIRAAFRRILAAARTENAQFVLIAGDLFEHDRVTPDTVEFLKQQFEELAPIRVFITPGNHDPYIAGSPYVEERWPEHVHIFRAEEFHSVEIPDAGVRITGFGFNRSHINDRLLSRLAPLPSDAFNIVVFHGSDANLTPAGKNQYAPFTIDELAGKNIGYCALGHYHQQREVANPLDRTPVWYCGIPEGRGWDEEGAGGFLLVETATGSASVRNIPSTQYPLQTIKIVCDGFSTREQIIDAILQQRGYRYDPNTILRVRLQGLLDPRVRLSFAEMEERLAGEALHIAWDDRTSPAVDYISIAEEKTLRGFFAHIINARIAGAPEAERAVLELARQYGIEALLGREVRPR